MDVSPMSLQMVVPRANEASQVQHNLNHQTNVAQDFAMLKSEAESQMRMEQVQKRDQTEDGKIKKDDPNGRGNQQYRGRRRNKKEEDEDDESEKVSLDMFRGHNIDISF
ncbi:MAG: hypothetical protein IJT82_00595 [Schwartzia sp.]|nr:hypothetical protein [Schwartzia sp. (in: firmicutes)]